jgi:hypothetical protein
MHADVEKVLGREGSKKPQIPVIKLKKLDSKSVGVAIVHSHCPDISTQDATALADYFGCNPLMLEIVSSAVRDGRMAIQEVTNMCKGMAGVNIVDMAAGDYVLQTVGTTMTSFMRLQLKGTLWIPKSIICGAPVC